MLDHGIDLAEDASARAAAFDRSVTLHKAHCLKLGYSVHSPSVAAVLASDSPQERKATLQIHCVAGAAWHAGLIDDRTFNFEYLKEYESGMRGDRRKGNARAILTPPRWELLRAAPLR